MSFVISGSYPFPNIWWFANVLSASQLKWEVHEHFLKASYHNRYYIATANGKLALSIPLELGRQQRTTITELKISYRERWQQQHWRTLTAAYGRSPFFAHFEPELKALFTREFTYLNDFNHAAAGWLKSVTRLAFQESDTTQYTRHYGDDFTDLRGLRPQSEELPCFPPYLQVFSSRIGFVPNLSMLDLLFMEGPYATQWIRKNLPEILSGKV